MICKKLRNLAEPCGAGGKRGRSCKWHVVQRPCERHKLHHGCGLVDVNDGGYDVMKKPSRKNHRCRSMNNHSSMDS